MDKKTVIGGGLIGLGFWWLWKHGGGSGGLGPGGKGGGEPKPPKKIFKEIGLVVTDREGVVKVGTNIVVDQNRIYKLDGGKEMSLEAGINIVNQAEKVHFWVNGMAREGWYQKAHKAIRKTGVEILNHDVSVQDRDPQTGLPNA